MKMSAQEKFNRTCEETNALSKDIQRLNNDVLGKIVITRALIDAIMKLPKSQKDELISDLHRKANLSFFNGEEAS
jgi:ribosomal 50S subunit-associated protein YjgA (DUF615 family)